MASMLRMIVTRVMSTSVSSSKVTSKVPPLGTSAATARIVARPELPPLPVAAQAPEIPMIPPEQARRA